jgi:hypothetical protein
MKPIYKAGDRVEFAYKVDWRSYRFHPSELPCCVCGSTVQTGQEPRFGYVVCEEHSRLSPVDINKYTRGGGRMRDIVERLRGPLNHMDASVIVLDAANEIDALRAKLAAMTEKARQEYLSAIEWAGRHQVLSEQLEVERMRVVACGIVASSDTPKSATLARAMAEKYRSSACEDVARRVDEYIKLRGELKEAKKWKEAVEEELLVCCIPNASHADPKKAVQAIANWHSTVAVDPSVSEAASKLQTAVAESCAKVCENRANGWVSAVFDVDDVRGEGLFLAEAIRNQKWRKYL